MSTQIKAIKCPSCGSEKHIDLGDNHFRCRNCGTEFYIDDDDITINVKHHFDFGGKSLDQSRKIMGIIALAIIIGTMVMLLLNFSMIFVGHHYDNTESPSLSGDDSVNVEDDYKFIIPMQRGKDICFFYLTKRSFNTHSDTLPKFTDGYYFGFIDSKTARC